jgi:hypothetical protein
MFSNLLEATPSPSRKTRSNEAILIILPQGLLVESGLQVLEGESEVEDGDVGVYGYVSGISQ